MIKYKRKHTVISKKGPLLVWTTLLILVSSPSVSQNSNAALSGFPSERMYLHVNTPLVFVGEYLLYSLYCLDNISLRPSQVSKIGYVELIGEDFKTIFKQKLRLENGRSYSDFFLPTSIPSGNYKLIAYTQWMRNFDLENSFQQDITIINPYQSNQNVFLKQKPEKGTLFENQRTVLAQEKKRTVSERADNGTWNIQLDAKRFEKRQKVVFQLNSDAKLDQAYHISISVRKIDTLLSAKRIPANTVPKTEIVKATEMTNGKKNYLFLPELRGELLSGKVVDEMTNEPAVGLNVSLSIPEHVEFFSTAMTDESGMFHFSVQNEYESDKAVFQVIDKKKKNLRVEITELNKMEYPDLKFHKFQLSKTMEEEILKRSFNNQIENAFFEMKPDTIRSVNRKNPFFLNNSVVFELDDYTRFSTLKETTVEVIEHLWTTQGAFGNQIFKVRVNPPYAESNKEPLLLIDGIQVQDHESVFDFNAKRITKILIGRDRYVFGSKVYEGAISIETVDGGFNFPESNASAQKVELFRPQSKKNYFKQVYEIGNENYELGKIPDFRNQLMWVPSDLIEKPETFFFYTSDVPGKYEIVVEGFSLDGNPLSLKDIFITE